MNHLRQAFRQIVLRPGLSVVVIVMLALGIGATTAMYSLFHQVLVRPLPVPEPDRLVNLVSPGPKAGPTRVGSAVMDPDAAFSYPMFRDLEAGQSAFTGLAAHLDFQANLADGAQTLAGRGTFVSGSYFGVLGLEPALGRLIGPRDEPRVGEAAVAVLSYEYWQSRFGGDPGAVDRTLIVNGQRLTIVGVAPEGFSGTMLGWRPEVFVPVTLRWLLQPEAPADYEDRRSYWLYVFGRLRPDVSAAQASASLNGLYGGVLRDVEAPRIGDLGDDVMARFVERRVVLEPGVRGQSVLHGPAVLPLTLLLLVTGSVLLIVCVNLANLLLARGASRRGEMAIRSSVGASRAALTAQLLLESAVLAVIGAVASLPVAAAALRLVASVIPAQFADRLLVELSPAAMLFAAGATVCTVLLFALAPAWRISDTDPGRIVKGQSAQTSGGRGMTRFRSTLMTAQIAVSLALLVLAGLFTQSLANIARVDLGIDAESLVSFSVSPGLNGYDGERMSGIYERIEQELAAQPGVTHVGSSMVAQVGLRTFTFPVSVDGFEAAAGVDASSGGNFVSAGYLDALSMPLLAGRGLTAEDTQGAPRVAIVNERFVRRFGLGDDAVGTRFGVGSASAPDIEIVGVVADAAYGGVKGAPPPQFYQPWRQTGGSPWLTYYVRGSLGTDALMRMIPGVVSGVDPTLPVSNLATVQGQVDDTVFLDRLVAVLSASFAGLATLLAAIGLYGVLSYNVAQRTRELGLRLALGAAPSGLRRIVLVQVGRMALIGGGVGLVVGAAAGRAAEALLFGLSGYDPRVLGAAVAVLGLVVLAAAYAPARRASSIAPMEALRHE